MPSAPRDDSLPEARLAISPSCTLEDHGDAFYLVLDHDGLDLTIAISCDVAKVLSDYLAGRLSIPRA